jgi:2-polyprenyl-3-methyl-5-hydroxy-6-metoxy-1,4-benzoquinol methylase
MNTHAAALREFIEEQKHVTLEDQRPTFDAIFDLIKRFRTIDTNTKVLEIGTGTGWLLLCCEQLGMKSKGIEVRPELVQWAHQLGLKYGITPDIDLGNLDEIDISINEYDVIIATSTFEHVKNWKSGLQKVFHALKPGGLFYFYSTNKFSFRQGEYNFPLYSWLPNKWRYSLRKARQGEEILQWGIDFHQFTYFGLRRFFKQLGFSIVLDRIDVLDPNNLNHPTPQKKLIVRLLKGIRPLKHWALFFSDGTLFICIK